MLSTYCWRGITADTALRLAKCFGTTPEFWMNLQFAHDLSRASAESGRDINRQVEPLSDATA
ncbi:addiction module antidote protein, HigA family [Hwanghaeella grinnelliae]|uniref:Addiction module antidote protein, HigA family n=1 Tax=Hwanghaeella grinnelliae TaxID=2500179 RepID=A0A3S2WBP0_9PROT|nr:addiction module antidote protein, HigA family [Hwanghaeella grinnelliae]